MNLIVPLTPLWFRKRRVYRSKAYFETKLQETLDQELDLDGSARVFGSVAREGVWKKPELRLFGEVEDQQIRERAEAVASYLGEGTVDLVNEILVLKQQSKRI